MDPVAFGLALIPGLIWLVFYLQEDCHPEPKSLLLVTFVVGGLFALFAVVVEIVFTKFLGQIGVASFGFIAIIGLALIEELAKFAAAYVSVDHDSAFDEPIDAMIYLVVAALGFATIENIGAISGHSTAFIPWSYSLQVASLRFVGATLLHTLTSGLLGYYWAKDIREFYRLRYLLWGIVLATGLHAVFNYLILQYQDIIYPVIFVTAVGFFILSDFERLRGETV